MAAIYSNGGNRWNILGFNFTKRDALSSLYKISMGGMFYTVLEFYSIVLGFYISYSCTVKFLTTYTIFLKNNLLYTPLVEISQS